MGKSLITRIMLWGSLPLTGALGLATLTAQAQEGDPGGLQLTLGVEQRLETTDNLDLDVTSAGRTSQASTRLTLGLLTETPVSRLKFDAGGTLRLSNPPGASSDFTIDNKRLALSYGHDSANAALNLGASLSEADIEYLRPLDDFLDEDGNIVLPDDLESLTGTGTRRNTTANAALDWGKDAPWGFGVNARISKLDYTNTTSPSLFDSERWTLGANLRFAIDPATEAAFNVSHSQFSDSDPLSDTRSTDHFGVDLTRARPNGAVTAKFTADSTVDGTRMNLTFGRRLELPTGSLAFSLGANRSVNGKTSLGGDLAWQHALPNGNINARLQRMGTSGADDTDRLMTTLSVGASHKLSEISSIGINLAYSDSENTTSGTSITNASLGATYNRMLTEDWGLDLGYKHNRRETTAGQADSDTVFLALRRSFDLRP